MTTTVHDTAAVTAVGGSDVPDTVVPGGLAAALLACGIGCVVLGVAIVLAEASPVAKERLTLHQGVGPLSGKTVVASVAYLGSWPVLALALRGRAVNFRFISWATGILLAIGLLLTFPPVYQLFVPAPPAHAPAHVSGAQGHH